MTMLWPMEPTVAASDFDPFTKAVAMPVTVQSTSTRPRAAAKSSATTRPVLRNLLEMGLACGDGVEELEGRLQQTDAAQRQADRAAAAAANEGSEPGNDNDEATTAPAPDPRAIAAATSALQSMHQRRSRLAEELETLDRQEAALKAALLRLLGRGRVPTKPAPPDLPAGTGLPTAARR
jgi:hypothetical protein